MKHLAAILIALVLCVADAMAQPVATGTGLPAPGTSVALNATAAGYTAQISVDPAKHFTTIALSSTDPAIAGALHVETVKNPDGYIRQMQVTLSTGVLRQGPHPMTLTATAGNDRMAPFDLSLVVPEVKLDPPDTLVVQRIIRAPALGLADRVSATSPQLWPINRDAWLSGVVVLQRGDTDAGGVPAGRIVPGPDPLPPQPPESDIRIVLGRQIRLLGAFPLGTAKGKLMVEADQLSQGVPLPFEIRTRLSLAYLFLVIIAGLGAGYLTRVWLQTLVTLNQERQKGFALIDVIDAAMREDRDATFLQAAEQARRTAAEAVRATDVKQIQDGVTQAQKALQDAQKALADRRTALDQKCAALLSIVRTAWRVPPDLAKLLEQARAWLQAGPPALQRNDVASAASELDAERVGWAQRATASARAWAGTVAALIDGLAAAAPLIGGAAAAAAMKQQLDGDRQPLLTSAQHLEDDPTAPPDALQALLQAMHVACTHLDDTMSAAQGTMRRQVAAWASQLAGATLPQPSTWTLWHTAAATLADRLTPTANDPAGSAEAVAGVPDLLSRLRQALRVQGADPSAVAAACDAGEYDAAVSLVAKAAQPVTGEGRPMGEVALAEAGPIAPEPLRLTTALVIAAPVTTSTAGGPPPLDVLAALSRRTAATASRLLWLIYAMVIVVGGYFIFADKWVGTPSDWATAFFWAWGTNVGADAATEAVKGLRKT